MSGSLSAQAPRQALERVVVGGDRAGLGAVVGIVGLPNGRLALLDRLDQQLLIFDSAGARVRVAGGRGEGPGEFRAAARLGVVDSRIWVADGVLRRYSWFGVAAADLMATRVEPTGSLRLPKDGFTGLNRMVVAPRSARGSLVAIQAPRPEGPPSRTLVVDVRDDSSAVILADISTDPACRVLGKKGNGVMSVRVPFCVREHWAISPGVEAFVQSREVPGDRGTVALNIERHDLGGGGHQPIRLVRTPVPIAPSGRDSIEQSLRRNLAEFGATFEGDLDQFIPSFEPVLRDIVIADDRSIVLLERSRSIAGGAEVLTRIAADGRTLASWTVRPGLQPMWTDGRTVLGVRLDDDGVPSVVRVELR